MKKNIYVTFLAVLFFGCFFMGTSYAGTASLTWNANTEPDLAGYKIYYGTSARTCSNPGLTGSTMCGYTSSLSVGNVTNYVFNNLTDGVTYYFSVSAYDTSNNHSSFSGEVSKIIPPVGDTTAPTTPTSLVATAVSSTQINLTWTASTDNVGVTGYRIYRCTGSGCTAMSEIGTSATNSYSNTGLIASTLYRYSVSAYDAADNGSVASVVAQATTQVALDTTAPTVSLSAPAQDAVVSGSSVTISATASDNVGVVGVQFKLNGVNLGTEDTTSPYSIIWDTTSAPNGFHTLTATARDAAGNTTTSSSRTVSVSNTIPDTTAPIISAGSPTGSQPTGTTQVTLSVTTNKDATCKYSSVADISYPSMANTFSTTGGTAHSAIISGLSNGTTYNRYIKCQDSFTNINVSDYIVTFSIATTPTVVTCTSFTYSGWSACQSNNTQTRTVSSLLPSGCSGGSPILSQSCTYVAPSGGGGGGGYVSPTCTSFTYSAWAACQPNNIQTRTYSALPFGCTGGSPVITQTCGAIQLIVEAPTSGGLTISNHPASATLTPVQIRNLIMRPASAGVAIAESSIVNSRTIVFEALAFDTENSRVKLEVELRNTAEQFTGVPVLTSEYVNSGSVVSVSRDELINGSYKFRARVRSERGVLSDWLWFGTQSKVDFTINTVSTTASSGSGYNFTANLNVGTRNSEVSLLQTALKSVGLFTYPTITEYFGNVTKQAVVAFQQKYGLTADGVVGPGTRAKLNEVFGGGIAASAPATSAPVSGKYNFTANLNVGTRNSEVSLLQTALKSVGLFTYPTITEYFGNVTKQAVVAFQQKYGLTADGVVGYGTRLKLNEVFGSTTPLSGQGVTTPAPVTTIPISTTPSTSSSLTGPLGIGMRSEQVKILQTYLAKDKFIYPEGVTDGYYGSTVVQAVERFQCKYQSICSGTPDSNGYGLAGPKTRAKIVEILK